ncbi:hypothetical protein [Halomonas sp. H5]|uniref:hypothetical protein n=1 Tax=Halomonas sp. H5 TaxID=3423910 RepID=UPI003D36486A
MSEALSHGPARGAHLWIPHRGQPPSRGAVAWNLISSWVGRWPGRERHLEARFREALVKDRWRPAQEGPGRQLMQALRERRLGPGAASVLVGLARRLGWDDDTALLIDAWHMLLGGVVLGDDPQSGHRASELAALAAAQAGWQVLCIIPEGEPGGLRARRLMAAAAALELSHARISSEDPRDLRRQAYGAALVCVPLATLALDLLHGAREARRSGVALRRRLARLAETAPQGALVSSGHPCLALLVDAGELLCDRALDTVALRSQDACSSERALATQALALAELLHPERHFVLCGDERLPELTEEGGRVLEGLAHSRGGLLLDPALRHEAVAAALLVTRAWQADRQYVVGPEGIAIAEERLQPLLDAWRPGLRTLLEVEQGLARSDALLSQARVHSLLSGLERLGGYGWYRQAVSHELARLYDCALWRRRAPAGPTSIALHQVSVHSDAEALTHARERLEAAAPGTCGLVLPDALVTDLETTAAPVLSLSAALRACRYGGDREDRPEAAVLILTADQDPVELAQALVVRRWPGVRRCAVIMLPGDAAGWPWSPLGLRGSRWRAGRLARQRAALKRRLLQRDQGMQRLLHFSE